MSRIGDRPIPLSTGIDVKQDGVKVEISGKLGVLTHIIPDCVSISVENNELRVGAGNHSRQCKALHGLTRSLLANLVTGVDTGFEKKLEIHGVGYRAQVSGKNLILNVGYSHPVEFSIPDGIDITVVENTKVAVKGIDKQRVGQVAATIRQFRKPEPYKGKGIRYVGEYILMKEGKTV